MIEVWKAPDISSITEPGKLDERVLKDYSDLVTTALAMLRIKGNQLPPRWDSPHFTTKSSPSGSAM